jgi:nitroimidazol reductase NimA-like FMN-containing flavoprotein (pyridoxamine 5'-phosphate oxidase superfamily)
MSSTHVTPTAPSLWQLQEAECIELLHVATVGRIGFVSPDGLQIIPVSYRAGAGPRLFFKTAPDGIVAQLSEIGNEVAFEVDYHASDVGIAWSVLMHGEIHALDDQAHDAYEQLRLRPEPWPGPDRSLLLQFVPRDISGRGLHRR